MTFHFSQFLDSALGQLVGCFLAMMVILLVRDNSQARTVLVVMEETAAETNWFNSTRPVRACELSRTSRITIIARKQPTS